MNLLIYNSPSPSTWSSVLKIKTKLYTIIHTCAQLLLQLNSVAKINKNLCRNSQHKEIIGYFLCKMIFVKNIFKVTVFSLYL